MFENMSRQIKISQGIPYNGREITRSRIIEMIVAAHLVAHSNDGLSRLGLIFFVCELLEGLDLFVDFYTNKKTSEK